jgi:opacity protein-like surface antigen
MKIFHTLIAFVLSLTLMTLITGCGGGGGTTSNTGTVSLKLTDAPIDDENVAGVYVTFTALRYQYKDSNESWQDVDLNESRTINLLDLQDGNTTLLNKVELPAGEIQHVRFVLDTDNCYITFKDDTNTSLVLEVPSGDQTGYKSTNGFVIAAGGTTNITADFDVRKSVTVTGQGRYKLNPTIKLIDNIEVGEINGTMTLDANGSKVIVYAYTDGSFDESESNVTSNFGNAVLSTDATDGSYTLPWLTTGVYDLIVVATDTTGVFENILGYINDVTVETGVTTPQDITDDTLEDALL